MDYGFLIYGGVIAAATVLVVLGARLLIKRSRARTNESSGGQ